MILGPDGTALVVGNTESYGIGGIDLCMVEFKIGQCPLNIPDDGVPFEISGYPIIMFIGIAIPIVVFIIKTKHYDLNKNTK
jgi:hypothetical protein